MKKLAVALAVCVALYAAVPYAQAAFWNTASDQGKYAIAINASGTIVWRVDTTTGRVAWCSTLINQCSIWME
jgi:hypothetical protein